MITSRTLHSARPIQNSIRHISKVLAIATPEASLPELSPTASVKLTPSVLVLSGEMSATCLQVPCYQILDSTVLSYVSTPSLGGDPSSSSSSSKTPTSHSPPTSQRLPPAPAPRYLTKRMTPGSLNTIMSLLKETA